MLTKVRSRLTYGNVMATVAVFLALGGSAYAVAANSVGTAQLKNGAVTNPKLAADSVGTGKVIDGSVFRKDLKPGLLPSGASASNDPGSVAVTGGTPLLSLKDDGTEITIKSRARIFAEASIALFNGANAGNAECALNLGKNLVGGISQDTSTDFAANQHTEVTLVGSQVNPPGTYNVLVACFTVPDGLRYERGDLSVWAVPQQ